MQPGYPANRNACGPGGGYGGGAMAGGRYLGGAGGGAMVGGRPGYGDGMAGGGMAGGGMVGGGSMVGGAGGAPTFVEPSMDCAGATVGTGCAAGCSSAGCAVATGPSGLAFVGTGRGDYITETSYRYVGAGAGNLTMVTPRTILVGRILAVILSLLGLALLVFMLTRPEASTTSNQQSNFEVVPPEPEPEPVAIKVCEFWGDPHIKSFDGSHPSFYGEGEQVILQGGEVQIEGRYLGTKYTKGLAATDSIAVGFNGHIVIVGSIESGPITVDGQSVLQSFGSHTVGGGIAMIRYDQVGSLVDEATGIWEKRVVHMDLPGDIKVTVFRWKNYMDLRIEMPQQEGIDGACGNMNDDPSDDTTAQILERVGARVARGELLFPSRTHVHFTETEEKLLKLCAPARQQKAVSDCSAALGPSATERQMKACKLDVCFGSNEHALRMAKMLGI